MKKKNIYKYGRESAGQVIAHAKWCKGRGKRPSMSYLEERNPRKALILAKKCYAEEMTADASWWLNKLMTDTTGFGAEFVIKQIKNCVAKAGIKFEDIGMSEQRLIKEGYTVEARWWLNKLMTDTAGFGVEFVIKQIKNYVAKAGIKLADIGTNNEELEELKNKLGI